METKDQPIDPSQVPEWRSRLEQMITLTPPACVTNPRPVTPEDVQRAHAYLVEMISNTAMVDEAHEAQGNADWFMLGHISSVLYALTDSLSAILAASLPEGEEPGWRDKESAPKDGDR